MDYQRVVWRDSAQDLISHIKLNRLTYGVSQSAFLSTRCLVKISVKHTSKYHDTSEVINLYVDDLISGARTIDGAKLLKSELEYILSTYGSTIRKWEAKDINMLGKIEFEEFDEKDNYLILDNEMKKNLRYLGRGIIRYFQV